MLSHRDLEQIRAIVRDELARALRQPARSVAPTTPAEDESEEETVLAFGRATVAVVRGEPGAREREIEAEARFRLRHDSGWVTRARSWLRKAADAELTDADMLAYTRHWRAMCEARAAKARKTREANASKRRPR